MKMKFGFIGCGNMGGALAQAVAKSVNPFEIALCDAISKKPPHLPSLSVAVLLFSNKS